MKVEENVWRYIKSHLGYSDEEMKLFRENPVNKDILSKAPILMNKIIVAEVIESHGCNSHHKVGQKLYFDSAGNLLTKQCPERVCIYALNGLSKLIFASNELIYAGADPNKMRFKRVGCIDVGVRCGGWGHVVLEIRVEDKRSTES